VITVLVSASWDNFPLIEVPVLNLWRRNRYKGDSLKQDALALLVPIAATCAMILLFFYG